MLETHSGFSKRSCRLNSTLVLCIYDGVLWYLAWYFWFRAYITKELWFRCSTKYHNFSLFLDYDGVVTFYDNRYKSWICT